MRKTFSLIEVGKANARVVEGVKHEIRKYVKRERGKTLPPDCNIWEFACKVGSTAPLAETKTLSELAGAIDAVVTSGTDQVYVEILAVPAHRKSSTVTSSATPGTAVNVP